MKTLIYTLAIATLLPTTAFASPVEQLMSGDERLACEAIMCLSNPASQPTECNSALKKFNSIKFKYAHDTVTARRNFLNKCPASDRKDLDKLINSLVK
ncbi:TrbM/KikA/MpfK family conjugal transfer protein [Neisseria dentiae]|uniref:TrbM/KikA/MpfK family conjugal transfer protein n=1 Tax=Neisseria dentiae TaxID=194197 RepID=UPI0035A1A643